jgi:hypothetical protein
MAAHPPVWAAVGPSNAASNHARVAGEKGMPPRLGVIAVVHLLVTELRRWPRYRGSPGWEV